MGGWEKGNLRRRTENTQLHIYLSEQNSARRGIMKDIPVCQRERLQVDGWEGR